MPRVDLLQRHDIGPEFADDLCRASQIATPVATDACGYCKSRGEVVGWLRRAKSSGLLAAMSGDDSRFSLPWRARRSADGARGG